MCADPVRLMRSGWRRWRRWPTPISSPGSRATASWWRNARNPCCASGVPTCRCLRVHSSKRPPKAKKRLARLVLEHAGKARRVADLFTGIGTFALRLAETARVAASDSEPAAIKALQQAAGKASGLKPVDAQVRDLFRRPFMASELKDFDAVVFDPPRQGAEAQARELGKSAVPVVVAVSCDANTFARDAKILVNAGYKLASAVTRRPVPLFASRGNRGEIHPIATDSRPSAPATSSRRSCRRRALGMQWAQFVGQAAVRQLPG